MAEEREGVWKGLLSSELSDSDSSLPSKVSLSRNSVNYDYIRKNDF